MLPASSIGSFVSQLSSPRSRRGLPTIVLGSTIRSKSPAETPDPPDQVTSSISPAIETANRWMYWPM